MLVFDLLQDDLLDGRDTLLLVLIKVAEYAQILVRVLHDKVELHTVELVEVSIALADSRLVDLWRLLVHGYFEVLVNLGAGDVLHVEDELEEALQRGLRRLNNILVAYYMHRDLGVEPELVEVLPHCHVLLNEFTPHLRELNVVLVVDRAVMRTSADHVEKGCNGVDGVPHEQNSTLGIELGLAVALWIVRFHDHHALIHEALTSQTHEHQVLVQLLRNVAVRAGREAHDLLEVSTEQRVTRARETDHDDSVLIFCLLLVDVEEVFIGLGQTFGFFIARVHLRNQLSFERVEALRRKHGTVNLERNITLSAKSGQLLTSLACSDDGTIVLVNTSALIHMNPLLQLVALVQLI